MADLEIHLQNSTAQFRILNPELEYKITKVIMEECSLDYMHFAGRGGEKSAHQRSVPMYSLERKTFPTGLLWPLVDTLEVAEIDYEIIDNRIRPVGKPFNCDFPFKLDKNQTDALLETNNASRGYFKFPTGAGKTALIASIIAKFGVKTLVLETGIDLTRQNAKEISDFCMQKVNVIQGEDSDIESNCLITVASVDTLTANYEILQSINWFDQFEMVLADEVHHASFTKEKLIKKEVDGKKKIVGKLPPGFTGYYKVMMDSINAYYRYGFTATDEEVEKSIIALTGNLLLEVSEDSLIESGRVSKPIILLYYLPVQFFESETDAFRYGIYENEVRNRILITAMNTIVECGGSVLFMLDSKKYQLEQIKSWTNFPVLVGDTNKKLREQTYQDLRDGKTRGIIMTVSKEGLNLPSVDAIIRASGKKSVRLVVQEKGRGSRITEDKNTYLVIDFYDDDKYKRMYNELTGRYKTKKGYLVRHSEERLEIYKKTKLAQINFLESVQELTEFIRNYFMNKNGAI